MPWLGKTSMALGELICCICRLVKASKVKMGKRAEKKKGIKKFGGFNGVEPEKFMYNTTQLVDSSL